MVIQHEGAWSVLQDYIAFMHYANSFLFCYTLSLARPLVLIFQLPGMAVGYVMLIKVEKLYESQMPAKA